jgi:putative ABC transport system permease protein
MNLTLLRLAGRSLWHRRVTLALVTLTLSLSVALLLGVQYLRTEVKQTFLSTISGTDLIVGARSGPTNLLLYSVFHLGNATNNIRWSTFKALRDDDAVKWAVPLSLGDSYRGYRVVGTTNAFFEHYQYRNGTPLRLEKGGPFGDVFEAVLGAEVAAQQDLEIGDEVVLAHGTGRTSFIDHGNHPFKVRGILERTGTPVDRSVIVSLAAIEAIHIGWETGVPNPNQSITPAEAHRTNLTPESVTAALLGVHRPVQTFRLQRQINSYDGEPLTAILPGVALSEFWLILGGFEAALLAVSGFVVITGLVGLAAVLLTAQAQRNREMAILRANGASPLHIAGLFALECVLVALAAMLFGLLLWYAGAALLGPWLQSEWGLIIGWRWLTPLEWGLLACVPAFALLISLVPAGRAYRRTLSDGLHPRE